MAAELDDPPQPDRALRSFDGFYRREYREVVGLVYALSGSRIAAEDIAQDAFVAAHKRWEQVGRYDKPEAWVRRVAANLAVSAFRTRGREAAALARLKPRNSYLPPMPDEDADFWKAVRSLPRRQSQVIALHYLEDRPVADIAEILGCAEATVRVHLYNGRAGLSRRLGISPEEQP
ncbi:MAG: SigE family RNA polymerase sigma factor [Acidimicrobiia bacterium]|nr:SigE family RNA polymerase sigma factor [Acidimicrobiia bacterium]